VIVVRTEVWSTSKGNVVKAVTRDSLGRILGPTNQTANVTLNKAGVIVGRK
jgi:hypothetical protein